MSIHHFQRWRLASIARLHGLIKRLKQVEKDELYGIVGANWGFTRRAFEDYLDVLLAQKKIEIKGNIIKVKQK